MAHAARDDAMILDEQDVGDSCWNGRAHVSSTSLDKRKRTVVPLAPDSSENAPERMWIRLLMLVRPMPLPWVRATFASKPWPSSWTTRLRPPLDLSCVTSTRLAPE